VAGSFGAVAGSFNAAAMPGISAMAPAKARPIELRVKKFRRVRSFISPPTEKQIASLADTHRPRGRIIGIEERDSGAVR
jgi:hypothetical protein